MKHKKIEDVKIGEKVTVWYIKDGRAKFCNGIVKYDGSWDGIVTITDFDNIDTKIIRANIYDVTE